MIRFNCPYCANPIEVAVEFAGKSGRCRQCGGEIMAPMPAAPSGLDALRGLPDAPLDERPLPPAPEPGAPSPARRKPEPFKLVLPEVPAEVREKIRQRRRKTFLYIACAVIAAVVAIILVLPFILPQPQPVEPPREIAPVPRFAPEQGESSGE